jgi:hypothetical protein
MEGFSGLTLETKKASPLEPGIGFKGLSIETYKSVYLEPTYGFKGLDFQMERPGSSDVIYIYR